MPSINLAPGTQYVIAARKRRRRLYGVSMLIVAVFFGGWMLMYGYLLSLRNSSEDLEKELQGVNLRVQTLREDALRVTLFEKRLVDVNTILNNHISWDRVFGDLERLLPPDSVITSFDAQTGSSTVLLQGRTQNIDQIALALASLTSSAGTPSIFESGSVKEIARQEQESGAAYTFTMTLEFNQAILRQGAAL